jgi:phosphoribosylamine--glycine ligase
VGIVLAAKGYPESPRRGHPIDGLDAAAAGGARVFHAGTVARPQGGFGTNGGRVLTVVGRGQDLAAARDAAERAADAITWDGLHRRRDIAADVPEPVAGRAIGVPA